MATNVSGSRASRRSAVTAARSAARSAPPVEAPEVLADVLDAEADEAFGSNDVKPVVPRRSTARSESKQTATESHENVEGGSGQRGESMTTVLTPSASKSVALPMAQEDLTRKIEAGDLIIPKLRISQAMSKVNTIAATSGGTDGVPMGNWYHTGNNKNLGKTVYFIPVDMRKSRGYFVQGEGLMCRSFDMLTGEGDPGGLCEGTLEERHTLPESERGCPLRLWNDRQPPKCGRTYNYPGLLVSDPESEKPTVESVLLQLRSAATPAAMKLNSTVMNEGGGVWPHVLVELSIESKSNTRGTFFVPSVEFFDTTDAPEFARIRRRAFAMSEQMGRTTLRATIEDDGDSD